MSLYNTKVISKTVLLRPDKSILLIKRSLTDEKGPGEWDLPGGTVDEGEDYLSAAIRETKEETGITLAKENIELVFTRSGNYERGNRCWLFFLSRIPQEQSVTLSDEHSEDKWLPIESSLGEPLFQGQEQALRYIVEHILSD